MKIIGIHGFARAGKDTLAKFLVDNHGYTRFAFADPIREAVYALNPWVVDEADIFARLRLQNIVDSIGWESAKVNYPYIRELLQKFGTEVGRDLFGKDFWVKQTFSNIKRSKATNVVITDVRFDNEVAAVKKHKGYLVKIERPGIASVNGHVSDKGLPYHVFNLVMNNNGSLEDVEKGAARLAELVNNL